MMGHKDKLIDGYEWDIISCKGKGRTFYCYIVNNTGLTRYYKNRINRRSRKKIKNDLKKVKLGIDIDV